MTYGPIFFLQSVHIGCSVRLYLTLKYVQCHTKIALLVVSKRLCTKFRQVTYQVLPLNLFGQPLMSSYAISIRRMAYPKYSNAFYFWWPSRYRTASLRSDFVELTIAADLKTVDDYRSWSYGKCYFKSKEEKAKIAVYIFSSGDVHME